MGGLLAYTPGPLTMLPFLEPHQWALSSWKVLHLVPTTALTQTSASDLISFEHWNVTLLRIHAFPYVWYPVHKS